MVKDVNQLSYDDHHHCSQFSHVCRFGRNCTKTNADHQENIIHIPRILCEYDDKCKNLDQEDHINSFAHSNIRDVRLLCKHGDACRDRQTPDHYARYRHPMKFKDSGVVRYCNLNEKINFVSNQNNTVSLIKAYAQDQKWKPFSSKSIPNEILDWVRTIQPVHRCKPEIFESILLHGHVMGREFMEQLKRPKFAANSILEHSEIRQIPHLKRYYENAKNYVTAIVTQYYVKHNTTENSISIGTGPETRSHDNLSENPEDIIAKEEAYLGYNLAAHNVSTIRTKAIQIAEASLKLSKTLSGIGYETDVKLGTNKQVFSILGPHTGHYYGKVVIVFKRDILHHPDTNFTTQAATSFASGNVYEHRPWLGTSPNNEAKQIDLFHKSKLHASIPGYEYATAFELIGATSHHYNHTKKLDLGLDVELHHIIERWRKVDSHFVIEAHLPQLIPLDYIDHIYMPMSVHIALSENAREMLTRFFQNRVTIEDKNNDSFNLFVIDDLIKKFDSRAADIISKPIQGFVMTIQPTCFREHYLLPLTISQAFEQYQIKHPKISNDCSVFIYWQVMNGDMMLTLSNKPIEQTKKQKDLECLICYLAPKPRITDPVYHEQISYLANGHPFQHQKFLEKNEFAAKSTTLYIGCNTDDFMTFCLEINRSNNTVTLSHAGANSIYNHENMFGRFQREYFNLASLQYIHVSSGAEALPIRNLIVCFKKQNDLHAIFDDTFVKSKKAAMDKPAHNRQDSSSHSNDNKASSATTNNQSQESKGLIGRAKNAVGDKFNQAKAFILGGSKSIIKPCRDSIYCLIQFSGDGPDHNAKYSHPCRFGDKCRAPEAHLTHLPHQVPECSADRDCDKLTDPVHRSQFNHTGRPYFLIPCRHQDKCKNKSREHLIKFSHGEKVKAPMDPNESEDASNEQRSDNDKNGCTDKDHHQQQNLCKWGAQCRDINKSDHCKQFFHKTGSQLNRHTLTPCKWNPNCTDRSHSHRNKFWHP